jgi:ankyrin repeat protein
VSVKDFFKNKFGNAQAKAKKQLEARGIEYSPESFLKQISDSNAENVLLFVESGMNVETADSTGETALMKATKAGKGEIVKALLDGGADPKKVNAEGVPPLIQAIRSHQTDSARALIAGGANVDARDNAGFSSVMLAVLENQYDIAEAMINAGADVLVQNHSTLESALILAAQRGYTNLVELLLKNVITKDDRDAKDKKGMTALAWASLNGHLDTVKLLCSKKAGPNEADTTGMTPFLHACAAGHREIVDVLLDSGANIQIKNKNSQSALQLATGDVSSLLREKGTTG